MFSIYFPNKPQTWTRQSCFIDMVTLQKFCVQYSGRGRHSQIGMFTDHITIKCSFGKEGGLHGCVYIF